MSCALLTPDSRWTPQHSRVLPQEHRTKGWDAELLNTDLNKRCFVFGKMDEETLGNPTSEKCCPQKTWVIKWKSPGRNTSLQVKEAPKAQSSVGCWHCFWFQDSEKSVLYWLGNSLLASFHHAGRCNAGCWERNKISGLTQCWILHATVPTCQGRCTHWCSSSEIL